MAKIAQEEIDRILDATDIVEIVSDRVPLKKVGRNFKACCPFHNEKTPSFIVSPEKQIFHCFGCGAGGNAIGFLMKQDNMDFPEAVEFLARKAGIDISRFTREQGDSDSLFKKLYELNKLAATFFQNTLRSDTGKKALEYLKKRGVDNEILSMFRIGYAQDSWDALIKHCRAKKVEQGLLGKAGLTVPSAKDAGEYDRFRGRIVFPIFNEKGEVSAFGARVMDDSLPKYLNSPETIVYNKSNVLYGLNFAKKAIREMGYVIIVEGYMDVILPVQYGVLNIVATSGTALTPKQIRTLKKYADTAVVLFDPDQAGETVSLRGLDILIEEGMKVRLATLPEGDDPDSFVKKNGKDGFLKIIDQAKDLLTYKLDLLVKRKGSRDIEGIIKEMLPTISKVENLVIQSEYLTQLAERLGIHEASLRAEMKKVKPDYAYQSERDDDQQRSETKFKLSELHLLGLAISSRKLFDRIEEAVGIENFDDENIKNAMMLVKEIFSKGAEEIVPGKLISRSGQDEAVKEAILQASTKTHITKDQEKVLDDCIAYIRKENRGKTLKELAAKLRVAQEKNDQTEMKKLIVNINKIHKEKVA
ncbi:MAG: DNA primase [Candidatus Omnitrophica bacterium]|nr:DNA primase [Candidatus Omnitrophota bacterium]